MPSTDETCSFTDSAVGETSAVGTTVGIIVSTVELGIAVEGILVGNGVDVDSIAETSLAVQAVRRKRKTIMNFFMIAILAQAAVCIASLWDPGGNYSSVPAPRTALRAFMFYGVAPTKFSAYSASS